jgi:hypothetical protein
MTDPLTKRAPPGERHVCTAQDPWTPDKGRGAHPDAKDAGTCSEGCCDRYRCPHCGIEFTVEGADA